MKTSFVLWLSFLFCYYWACHSFHVSLVSGRVHCLEEQKSLLLQLKKNLRFDPSDSRKLLFWNESRPCSKWRGVSWDEEGHVAGLDLSGESISGGLDNSSTLFSLQYLKNLNLAFNNLSSVIPSTIKNLQSLTSLNLSSAGFVEQIPMEIAQLTRLNILDLSTLFYSEGSALKLENPNLVKLVQNLSEVRELYLDGININLKGKEWGHALSSSLPHLQVLSMSSCHLSGPIDSSLEILQNLSIIRLDNNVLLDPVPDFFARFPNLKQLDLSSCNLSGRFPNEIFQSLSLTSLNLSYNDGLHGSLPADFPQNGSLQTLVLSSTTFSGALPDSIRNLRQLSRLEISRCQFNGTLPDSMSNLTQLTYLDLSFNFFTGPIPLHIGNYLSLTIFLSLSHNALHERIPDSICNASNLQVLDLSHNNFSGVIPDCLPKSETLGVLSLGKNNLSGTIPDTFQASSTLKILDLSSNNLQGQVPKSLSNCKTLEVLNIGHNKIDDQFPCLLKTVTTLLVMVLRRNNFHGPIECPNMKGMIWKKLQIVDLCFNNFNGKLPGELFPTGKAMMLDENQIKSNLFDQYQVVVTMGAYEMTLTQILTAFPSVDLSSNLFEGPIPEEMTDFTALHFLNLSNNNLTGHIPSSIGKLQQLEALDLSNNSFTGQIPSQLSSLSFLSFLNFSSNHLVGMIPTGTQLQTFDASSFQGNDGLYGRPLTQSPDSSGSFAQSPKSGLHPQGQNKHENYDVKFIIGLELGVAFGLGIITWPLVFWKQWRIRYWNCVNFILCSIFPQIYIDYQRREGQWFKVLRWSR